MRRARVTHAADFHLKLDLKAELDFPEN
jgi:hypothetical protein